MTAGPEPPFADRHDVPIGDRPWFARYPPGVPTHLEIPSITLVELIRRSVERWPESTALLYYGTRYTYRRLWEESAALAGAFAADGIGPGDRVALYLPNCPAYPIAFLAALRRGAIVVQVSPLYHGVDLARLLADAEPKAIVALEIHYPEVEKLDLGSSAPIGYVAPLRAFYPWYVRPFVRAVLRRQGLPTAMPSGPRVRSWRAAVRHPPPPTEPPTVDPAVTPAVFQYTGGTTGTPKAAMLSHRNLVANVLQVQAWNTRREPGHDVTLAAIPFFHIYGLTVALLAALADGGAVVMETRPEPREILRLIQKYRPTQFPGVPALYQAINQNPELGRYDLTSIKFCLSGSAPLHLETARRFEAVTSAVLIEGYGLSEASPVTHANPTTGERRLGSVGLPVPETDQKVVDLETGQRTLGVGEVGELCVRGPQVMLGYYRQPDETALALRDGWLYTGDVARLDADGFCYLIDRKKDLINVGGFKVWPREVEEVLLQHPAIAEAAAVGADEPELGEVVHAYVVLRAGASATERELIDFVRERLAHYKAPRRVHFRASLPRSGVQKVLRRLLRGEPTPAGSPGEPPRAAPPAPDP